VAPCSFSDWPALFVEREYNASGEFAKATRESAATRATNSEGVSGIHLEPLITCSFTAEVVNELLTDCHFSVSAESVGLPPTGGDNLFRTEHEVPC
jgi:hypothetical protein